MQRPPTTADDYTNTCLVMGLVNLIWILLVIWAWQGFIAALLVSGLVYRSIIWLERRMHFKKI